MALAEAMALGLPIVTTRAGAVPDTVGEAALVVQLDDPPAFTEALRQVLTNVALHDRLAEQSLVRSSGCLPGATRRRSWAAFWTSWPDGHLIAPGEVSAPPRRGHGWMTPSASAGLRTTREARRMPS